jgi:hypothetical protein
MSIRRLFPLWFCFMLAVLPALGADQTPEQARLNHYVGEWDGTLSSLPGAKTHISCEWILDGAYLRHTISVTGVPTGIPAINAVQIMTYDPAKAVYRAWSFYSNGMSVQGEGTWDDSAHTFTWTNHDEADGTTTATVVSFLDANSESTVTQIKDRAGKVVAEIQGTKTKRK